MRPLPIWSLVIIRSDQTGVALVMSDAVRAQRGKTPLKDIQILKLLRRA
jgi:hypothetical protein